MYMCLHVSVYLYVFYIAGHDVFESGNTQGSIHLQHNALTTDELDVYRNGVFALLVYIPVACAFIQVRFYLCLNT